MYKSLMGIAAAAMLFIIAAPAPADAFAVRHAAGAQDAQANVEQVWHYGRPHRRIYRQRYVYRTYPYEAYPYPYAYAPYPYPYYRRYYAPAPFVQFGPFGVGVW